MSYEYSEDQLIEQATEDVLKDLGWQVDIPLKFPLWELILMF